MSEEIYKRGYDKKGDVLGDWEIFTIGETSINQLKKFGIVPNKTYGSDGRRAPDEIIIDRRNGTPEVIAIVEFKSPNEFNTEKKKLAAIEQCINSYCKPLNAKVGIITDRTEYIWVNPQHESGYEVALREDGYQLEDIFNPKSDKEQSILTLSKCLGSFSSDNSTLLKTELRNPSDLADSVWQTIWLASGENPDICLATFVEIFLFKYLSDLGVLTYNNDGVDISFDNIIKVPDDKIFNFYFKNVRSYIKEIFPASADDGTSVINGIVLDPDIAEHNFIFKEILEGFRKFGELKNIDPDFKSRLYENFLKKSLSQKNWGQFFTPRNVVKAIIEMSGLKTLPSGSRVSDPACGVGGFLLESINTVRPRDYSFNKNTIDRKIEYIGTDRDKKTIILAKANMLIHMNELVRDFSKFPKEFSKIFNQTFKSCHSSILGSLSVLEEGTNDLILTNPPYVVTGTSTIKKYISESSDLTKYYRVNGAGVEGLFVEKIINSLKPGGKAFVVIPDGLLNRLSDEKLRKFILDECILLGLVSLPKNTFYTTPKKTYIICLQKKIDREDSQNDKVFTYLVSNTGETLDSHRFECENDFPSMVSNFKIFCADIESYEAKSIQCKVWPISKFTPNNHWSIDRWWTAKERIELGIDDEKTITDPTDFSLVLEKHQKLIEELSQRLKVAQQKVPKIEKYVEIELSNVDYFHLAIGKRVLKKDVYNSTGNIPVYSANVKDPFGFMDSSNIDIFSKPYVLWGIDGHFNFSVKLAGEKFRSTDHCGTIRIERDDINPLFIYYALHAIREENRLDRELRANLKNVSKFLIRIPVIHNINGTPKTVKGDVNKDGEKPDLFVFDIELQQKIVDYYTEFEEVKSQIYDSASHMNILEMETIKH